MCIDFGRVIGSGIYDTQSHYPNGHRTDKRLVANYELEFYISCDGATYINDEHFQLSPKTLIIGKPGQTRYSLTGFKCLYLHIEFADDNEYKKILDLAPPYYRIIDGAVYERIFEELALHLFSADGANDGDNYVCAKLLELYYHIEKDSAKNANYKSVLTDDGADVVRTVIEHMEEHYGERLTLADLAALVGYSPSYFWHIFNSVMKTTPQKYLLDLRIKKAKQALCMGMGEISDIALDCGFSSQQHFNLMFKRETLITPLEYRKLSLAGYDETKSKKNT